MLMTERMLSPTVNHTSTENSSQTTAEVKKTFGTGKNERNTGFSEGIVGAILLAIARSRQQRSEVGGSAAEDGAFRFDAVSVTGLTHGEQP